MARDAQYAGALRRVYALERERDAEGLIRMLDNPVELNPEATVRAAAAAALGRLGDPVAGDALTAAVDDRSEEVRFAVIRAIGELRARQAGSALVDALRDGSVDVRRAATISLGLVGFEEAVPVLRQQLEVEDRWTRLYAAESLAQLDDPQLGVLLPHVRSSETRLAFGRRKRWKALERKVAAAASRMPGQAS